MITTPGESLTAMGPHPSDVNSALLHHLSQGQIQDTQCRFKYKKIGLFQAACDLNANHTNGGVVMLHMIRTACLDHGRHPVIKSSPPNQYNQILKCILTCDYKLRLFQGVKNDRVNKYTQTVRVTYTFSRPKCVISYN